MNYKFKDIELRPEYQQPIHDATIEHMRNSNEPAFISASVGAGKTVNIGAITSYVNSIGGRSLVVARTGKLIAQNSEMAWKMGVKNSVYSASRGTKSTFYPTVFASEGSLERALTTDFENLKFNVLLFDECHEINWANVLEALKDRQFMTGDYCQYAKIIAHFKMLNPKTKIIGYTGSPYRGREDIIGDFWRKKLYDVSTMYLVSINYLVPPVFGFGDGYDLSQWTPSQDAHSCSDFSKSALDEMQIAITKDEQKTQIIMEEVVAISESRSGGTMITCAGKKHCEQVAKYLPDGSWVIIVSGKGMSEKKKDKALDDARSGAIKYVLQVGCLTTGVNVPPWSTTVLLRRVGSLTLLTQLIGRILRINEAEDIANGFEKTDGLVLDYTDTFESFGDIYDDPLLDQARTFKAKDIGETQACLDCGVENSKFAIRCVGPADNEDGRCEYFFQSSLCLYPNPETGDKCMTHNAPSAKNCRKCGAIMIDPAKALKNKAYTEADFKEVMSMNWSATKTTNGIKIVYQLNSFIVENGVSKPEFATEYLSPFDDKPYKKSLWKKFVEDSISSARWRRVIADCRNAKEIVNNKAMFDKPTHITHRISESNGYTSSIINRRKYISGRETTK